MLLVLDTQPLPPPICGHVVASRVPPPEANRAPTDQGRGRTIGDAANYIIALPHERAEHCKRWRHAAELLLDQADVAAVSHQVHLALFYDANLDLATMSARETT